MGMQMRLGFSIAAFLEPDVLLVDEVLSVGDASFQQKCLNQIGKVVRQGTTLLYVSHDLASVEASCERALWLADAVVLAAGPTKEVVSQYRSAVEQNAAMTTSTEGVVQVLKADIKAADGGQVRSECDLDVCLTLNSPEAFDANFFIGVSQGTAFPMFIVRYSGSFPAGDFEVRCRLRNVPLAHGRYSLWPAMSGHLHGKGKPLLPWRPVTSFDVMGPDLPEAARGRHGALPRLCRGRLAGQLTGPGQGKKTRSRSEPRSLPVRIPAACAHWSRQLGPPQQSAAPGRSTRATIGPLPADRVGPHWPGDVGRARGR